MVLTESSRLRLPFGSGTPSRHRRRNDKLAHSQKAHSERAPQYWNIPRSRQVGSYGSVKLYHEALKVAERIGSISVDTLLSPDDGIGPRLRGLLFVPRITRTLARGMISEMLAYEWIRNSTDTAYRLSAAGALALEQANSNYDTFKKALLIKMQTRFIIPGWFVWRLQTINPDSGEVVLPSPPRSWKPSRRVWRGNEWTLILKEQATKAYRQCRVLRGAFPVPEKEWLSRLRDAIASNPPKENATYGPRGFLAKNMRKIALDILFDISRPNTEQKDFHRGKHPIPPRSFKSWCPLLADLDLIHYTDSHPEISGRLIFPCAAYKRINTLNGFMPIEKIREPGGRVLHLYHPPLGRRGVIKFSRTLFDSYLRFSRRSGTRYTSLLDVRDETCRRLRLLPRLFDEFLGETLRLSIKRGDPDFRMTISLESDIRPEQQSGHGLLRRPVYIDSIPHSLISINETLDTGT